MYIIRAENKNHMDQDNNRLEFNNDGTFKILHLSDVHYRIPDTDCRDVAPNELCTSGNNATLSFINRLIDVEKPDLIVHTGDIIDGDTHSAADGMNAIYGVSIKHKIKWTASLGNHDDDSDMSRPELIDYIIKMPGTLTVDNPLGNDDEYEAYGNYFLELFNSSTSTIPSFRTYHLDSNTNDISMNSDQINWFKKQSHINSIKGATPAMAFFHVPLQEYITALFKGDSIIGNVREHPSPSFINSGFFDALVDEGSVIATFVGHDHTNDYCAKYKDIQLCYEGSPGYQGYGQCSILKDPSNYCVSRRARVTQIRDWGSKVTSWKRIDVLPNRNNNEEEGASTYIEDDQILWEKNNELNNEDKNNFPLKPELKNLPFLSQ